MALDLDVGTAVGYVMATLTSAASDLTDKAVEAGKERLIGWLKGKLGGGAKGAALAEFEAAPDDGEAKEMLSATLTTHLNISSNGVLLWLPTLVKQEAV